MECQSHMQKFLSLKFLKSSQQEEGMPLGVTCYDTAWSCGKMPWLSVLLNGFCLPACFSCDSDCGSVNAASDKKQ